jgi:hypothetical protein
MKFAELQEQVAVYSKSFRKIAESDKQSCKKAGTYVHLIIN